MDFVHPPKVREARGRRASASLRLFQSTKRGQVRGPFKPNRGANGSKRKQQYARIGTHKRRTLAGAGWGSVGDDARPDDLHRVGRDRRRRHPDRECPGGKSSST